ncbi:MAG: hypothetical protein NVSMB2_19430 [Chloroflexota bacterium]
MSWTIGDEVDGRYDLRRQLSSGGMADVYVAIDKLTGREVVLKIPHSSIAGDLTAFGRFRREVAIGRRLDHPGIQRVLSDDYQRYAVLEYVEGQSLRALLAQRGRLTVDEVQQIGIQLADSLEYVHRQGVVHRDVKPDNILIAPDGHVTLTDFGIASTGGSRWVRIPQLTNAVGTPDYMAPEQVRGELGDARIDVYALGSVLYELLTGVVPYPAAEATSAARRRGPTEAPLIRRVRPDVPATIEALLYRALRRRAHERYPSAAALAVDLRDPERTAVPATYEPDEPPPSPIGDLPPWRTTIPIIALTLAALGALGAVAQCAHAGAAR